MADIKIPLEEVQAHLTRQRAKMDVVDACAQFALTLKEFGYELADPRGGRVLFCGDYIDLPRQIPLRGVVPDAIYSADVHVIIRVASGESEKTFQIFGIPPSWRYGGIRAFLEPRFEEWIVDLMTGEAND